MAEAVGLGIKIFDKIGLLSATGQGNFF